MNTEENKKFNILVVDDNPKNIQVIGNILQEANYQVGFAVNGKQALSLLQKATDYDLVLLDIDMPVMNGYETCKKIREDERLKELPVIFLTAMADSENIMKGFEAGGQDYITKPFNSNELLARVDTQIQLKYKNDLLKNMNQVLEQKVAERTIELSQANEKLSKLDKIKGDFLALISHELRTPLNGVIGFAELLKSRIEDPKHMELLAYLIQSAERLNKFSHVALLITELKTSTIGFNFIKQEVKSIIENALVQLQDMIDAKHIEIVIVNETDKIIVDIDESLIFLTIKNILDNAIRISHIKSQITITTSIENNFIKISIADQGPGFSQESLTQLFEILAISDILHHTSGFGLSLAAAKLIMDLHKGKIEVKNNSIGAEVTISIPLIEQ